MHYFILIYFQYGIAPQGPDSKWDQKQKRHKEYTFHQHHAFMTRSSSCNFNPEISLSAAFSIWLSLSSVLQI